MLWLVFIALSCVFIYLKVIKPLNYWKDKGIPHQKPWPVIGNMAPALLRTKSFIDVLRDYYNAFPNTRYYGLLQFSQPVLIVRDLDLIKQMTIKDFDHFTDHNQIFSEEVEPLMGRNLFSLKGQIWRDMRSTLSPSFTSSKMKAMFIFLSECSVQFTEYFEKQGSDIITVETKDIFTRFTNDAIASIAFGLKVNSLEERDNEFYMMGKNATNFSGIRAIKFFLFHVNPKLAKFLRLKLFAKEVEQFFRHIVKETIKQRAREGLVRPDMIHLLMEAQKGRLKQELVNDHTDSGFAVVEEFNLGKGEKHLKPKLTDDDITAQALVFFFAGFESVANLMSFLVYELAVNPEVQEKLQAEIDDVLEGSQGKISYEALMKMKYLDMVLSETLRKWPQGFQLERVCGKDYTIQPKTPDEMPFTIEKGLQIIIPVIGIHHDPKFFPNPDKFDPERFSEENKHNIEPFAYMPFGVGPRNCIASRLALLENKTLCFYLLSKFDIVVVEKTPIPLIMGKKSFNMMPDGGLWLGLKKRKAA